MVIPVNLVFEDAISEFTMVKILGSFGSKYQIANSYSRNGFGYIKANFRGFNQASVHTPFFVLTDLDNYECPLDLMNDWSVFPTHENMIFRIAVREIESWLLADRMGFADFTGISVANIPLNTDQIENPKLTLIQLAKKSRKRNVRGDIVPINNNARIGPNYNGCLMEYVSNNWNISRALEHSESFRRAHNALKEFGYKAPI